MTFRIEPKGEIFPGEGLTQKIERTIRDVIKLRGNVQWLDRGTIPEGARTIEDQRTWE